MQFFFSVTFPLRFVRSGFFRTLFHDAIRTLFGALVGCVP